MNRKTKQNEPEKFEELRIVLVGKTGLGKSAAGNTILGRKEFESKLSPSSVTSECAKARGVVDRRWEVSVIDTPGLFETELSNDDIMKEIGKCISLSSPGPHAFLVILQLGRFTPEEKDTVEIIQKTFGSEASMYTIVLFTHGDKLEGTTIEDFISDSKDLLRFVRQCSGGCHVFNNKDNTDDVQVTELLRKISNMVAENGGQHYTHEMYENAEEAIQDEIRKGKCREEAERKNKFLKRIFICVGAGLGAAAGGVAGPAGMGVGAAAGATAGAGVGLYASEKCTIQ